MTADSYSRTFEKSRHSDSDYKNKSEAAIAEFQQGKDTVTKAKEWVSENRYPIVFGSWVASMVIALGIVSRNPHQSPQQKIVQARVYAQGLTLAVLVASFALESNDLRAGKGRWETIKVVDPNDPEHKRLIDKRIHHEAYQGEDQWLDMIDAQERKMRSRGEKIRDHEEAKKEKKAQENGEEKAAEGGENKPQNKSGKKGSNNKDDAEA